MAWQGIIIVCVVYVAGSVDAIRRPRIVNGNDANIRDFPYMVSFRLNNVHVCGGAIISEKHIVTAAQCLRGIGMSSYDSLSRLSVVTGTSYRKGKGNVHEVVSVAIHPEYFYDGVEISNDIAVFTLKDAIIFNDKEQKVNLPKYHVELGDYASVTGWGSVQRLPVLYSKKLQVFKMKILSNEECQEQVLNPTLMVIDDIVVCTVHSKKSGACLGDAGSPLVVNGELVGIVSYAAGLFCASGYPDVYTNVYYYIDFINYVINAK